MIDLHLHLLPGVDDGPPTIEGSLAILEGAAQLGFRTLVTTPHLKQPLDPEYLALVRRALDLVRPEAEALGVYVSHGFEVMLQPGVPDQLADGHPLTLGDSSTILVELPFNVWPPFVDQTVFELQTAGYNVLLAHPERYTPALRQPELVLDLAARGVMLQVTYASLAGVFGRECQRFADMLLQRDLATILATDAHSDGRRLTAVTEGLKRARQLVGPDRVDQLVVANPASLLDDLPLPEPVPLESAPVQAGLLDSVRRWVGSGS